MTDQPKRELTPEEREARRAALARGRETAAANRVKKAQEKADEALLRAAAPPEPPPEEPTAPPKPSETDQPALPPEPDPETEIRAERRQRLLGDMDAEVATLFSDDELEQIDAEEKTKALAERKKQALSDVRSIARMHARVDNDLIPADVLRSEEEQKFLNEEIWFRPWVPMNGAGHGEMSGPRVNGRLFANGVPVKIPRHVAMSLAANCYRTWLDETRFATLNQQAPGNSAPEVLGRTMPKLFLEEWEVPRAA